jgi:hypothetical protein
MGDERCGTCRSLLSEGLDLCVRARKLDSQERTNLMAEMAPGMDMERYATRHNADPDYWHQPVMTRSGTIPLWVADQYERDLAKWEEKSRFHLMQGCDDHPRRTSGE